MRGSPRVLQLLSVSWVFCLCQNCHVPRSLSTPKCSTRFDSPSLPCPTISFFFVELNYATVRCSLQHICTFLILFAAPLHFLYLFLLCTPLFAFLVSLLSPLLASLSIYYHAAAELSVIYTVNYPCHGSSYEPYLEDQ